LVARGLSPPTARPSSRRYRRRDVETLQRPEWLHCRLLLRRYQLSIELFRGSGEFLLLSHLESGPV
jgi:hypothetical protein